MSTITMNLLSWNYQCALLLVCAWRYLGVHAASKETSLLMIGNGFSDGNELEEMIQTMLEHDIEYSQNVYAKRFREGSTRFDDDAKNEAIHSTISERSWTWVVLQEQSQIPGLYGTSSQPEFDKSLDAAVKLNDWITASNSEAVLLMTWGQKSGDPMNPQLFKDFPTMQDRLRYGYEQMQQKMSSNKPVRIAPAGLAFREVYNDSAKNGPPDQSSSLFAKLYEADGKYPSKWGSYLVAATMYGTLSGKDPLNISYKPSEFSRMDQTMLLEAASRALTAFNRENAYNRQYWDARSGHHSGENREKKPYVPQDQTKKNTYRPSSGNSMLVISGIILVLGIVGGRRIMTQYRSPKTIPMRYQEIPMTSNNMELVDVPQRPNQSLL